MEVREYSNNDMKEIIRIWNEVVEEGIAFPQLGTIPGGFRMKDGHYENICPYYKEL